MKKYYETLENAVEQYIGSPVLKRIREEPEAALKLNKQWIDATMLFMDIRGFTKIAENNPADKLLDYLNVYFGIMSEIIIRHKGYIDSFIGDAVFAFFGIADDEHADNACKAAAECLEKLDTVNSKIDSDTVFDIGIGINTGRVVLGNIGSSYKLKFTVMGDMVNLASRMESITKKYGCNIIISEYTKNLLSPGFNIRDLDKIAVKGFKEGLNIYSLEV